MVYTLRLVCNYTGCKRFGGGGKANYIMSGERQKKDIKRTRRIK
jgi:hypothetical protein